MKSKKNLYNDQVIIDYITKTPSFKIILFFSIFTSIYGSYIIGNGINDFLTPIIISHTSPYYNIMFFSILAVNTINTSRIFIENNDYTLRLETRTNYLKKLIKITTKINIILIIIQLLSFFTILNFTKLGELKIQKYSNYGINNLIYSIFFIFRYYTYAIFFSIINTLFYEYLKEKKTLIIDFIFIIFFAFNLPSEKSSLSLLPWTYFKLKTYPSFKTELIISILFLIIMLIFIIILFKIVRKRQHLFNKYFIYNDLNYLLKRQKKVLIIILLIPIITIIINLNKAVPSLTIIKNTLGLTFNLKTYNPLLAIMYFFNIVSFLYLTLSNYIKDYQTNLDQIYLRMGFKDLYLQKTILNFIILFLIKLIQYIILILILFLNHYQLQLIPILNLFITDYLYIIAITQLLLAIYLSYTIFSKRRIISIIISVIIIISIPLNIASLQEYKNILLLVLLVIITYNNYLNVNYHKKIINELGGK